MKKEFYYVIRCKKATGFETYKTIHATNGDNKTLCGKELGGMWWIDTSDMHTQEDVSCKKCRSKLVENASVLERRDE